MMAGRTASLARRRALVRARYAERANMSEKKLYEAGITMAGNETLRCKGVLATPRAAAVTTHEREHCTSSTARSATVSLYKPLARLSATVSVTAPAATSSAVGE